MLAEVAGTHCFKDITVEEWQWLITFITTGGKSLKAYEEFQKAVIDPDGMIRVNDRRERRDCDFGADLYWIPLGAGGWFVRLNGRIYEAITAFRERRSPLDLFHTALPGIEHIRHAVKHLGRLKDAGELTSAKVSFGKMDNVRQALEIAREARGVLGANGITLEYPVIRHMNNLESVLTYEGTHEVHTLVVGQALTGQNAFR